LEIFHSHPSIFPSCHFFSPWLLSPTRSSRRLSSSRQQHAGAQGPPMAASLPLRRAPSSKLDASPAALPAAAPPCELPVPVFLTAARKSFLPAVAPMPPAFPWRPADAAMAELLGSTPTPCSSPLPAPSSELPVPCSKGAHPTSQRPSPSQLWWWVLVEVSHGDASSLPCFFF
jgi:hypothetical protein